jgi:hypothetical protein
MKMGKALSVWKAPCSTSKEAISPRWEKKTSGRLLAIFARPNSRKEVCRQALQLGAAIKRQGMVA